ncbi:MAG: hypothetical protein M3245_00455 [Actinomycetota bacterium]|nr:hypothetical protein [Actinomycetota bacterium]
MSRLRALLRREGGMSLAELMTTMMVMAIAVSATLSVLSSTQAAVGREQRRSRMNDQARLAVQQVDREVRSGSLIYDPALETVPFQRLRVLTQANATTRIPPTQCVQWELLPTGELRRRSWVPGAAPTVVSDWRVVAEDIVNADPSVGEPTFRLDPEVEGGRVLDVTLIVRSGGPQGVSRDIRVNTSIAIRNSTEGDPCTPVPA